MLQNIRDNSQGWIAKTIIGLIVVLMALTGVDAIITGTGNSQNAAAVNGEKISLNELNQAVEMQRRQLLQQLTALHFHSLVELVQADLLAIHRGCVLAIASAGNDCINASQRHENDDQADDGFGNPTL